MSTTLTSAPTRTLAELLERLGNVPLDRVRSQPPPGTATEEHLLATHDHDDCLCELVDGVLVEKAMGLRESFLAIALAAFLRQFVVPRNLGLVSGADGMMRLFPGMVRSPDVAYASWARFPNRRIPTEPIPDLVPDLAAEVLSASNTKGEMERKRRDYFSAGVRLVWEVDPVTRSVAVYTGEDQCTVLEETQTLEGGDVLPGFALPLKDLFAELDRQG